LKTRSIILAVLLAGLASAAVAQTQRLTILHTNDVHGHLRPFSYPGISLLRGGNVSAGSMMPAGLVGAFDLPGRRDIGGIARRSTLAARIRAELAGQGTPVWLMDAGDFFFYSAFSNEYQGEADVLAMNRAGYDFATFGNHDFAVTLPQLRRLIADARFDFLCANVTDAASGRPLARPWEVRQVGPARVGIFGLVTGSVARSIAADGRALRVADPADAARSTVAELRGRERVDLVVLISHCGEPADVRLAREVPGIDVIVGAHSHTRLPDGELASWSDTLRADELGGTVIVQAGQWAGELGRLDLLLVRNAAGKWRVGRYRERLVPVTAATPDDPAVAAVLDSLWAPLAAKYDEVLATATDDFAERGDDLPQVALAADAVRAATGAELAFEGAGGIHWPIVAGPVTRASLVDFDQRRDTVVTFRLRGSEVRRFLARAKPVASGLSYRVFRGELQAVAVGGTPLDDARVYSCAAGSSLAGRMGEYGPQDVRASGRRWADVVFDAIRRARSITPAYDGRRVVVDTLRSYREE
jgi:5'-nucleotidase / UDP-sugar diphosphatase